MGSNAWDGFDAETASQLFRFADLRLSSGISVSRTWDEVTLLRRLIRLAGTNGDTADLLSLSSDARQSAAGLRRPGRITRSEVSQVWQAFQRFIELMVEPPSEALNRINDIRQLLIERPVNGWHREDHVTGGLPRSRAPRRPALLFLEDLLALTERAKQGKAGERAQRDSALVALICWSPLTMGEVSRLRWEDLLWDGQGDPFSAWATCERRGIPLRLPIHKRASEHLGVLHAIVKRVMDRTPQGPVFRALRHPYLPLEYRDIKDVLDRSMHNAKLHASRHDILAAYAHYLVKSHRFSAPDLRECLGYREPVRVGRLLAAHEAWEIDRKVDQQGGLFSELS